MKAFAIIRNQPINPKNHKEAIVRQSLDISIKQPTIKQPRPTMTEPHIIDMRKKVRYNIQEISIGNFKSLQLPSQQKKQQETIQSLERNKDNRKRIFTKESQKLEEIKSCKERDSQIQSIRNIQEDIRQQSLGSPQARSIRLQQSFQSLNEDPNQVLKSSKPRIDKQTGNPYKKIVVQALNLPEKASIEELSSIQKRQEQDSKIRSSKIQNRTPIFKRTEKKSLNNSELQMNGSTIRRNKRIFTQTNINRSPYRELQIQSRVKEISYFPDKQKIHKLRPKKYSMGCSKKFNEQIIQNNESRIQERSRISSCSQISIQIISIKRAKPFGI